MKFVERVPKPREYDTTPDPQKYGCCSGCDKPMSEYDSGHSQGNHCAECFANIWWDDKYYYCGLHQKKPPNNNPIQKLIDSKAYKNRNITEYF